MEYDLICCQRKLTLTRAITFYHGKSGPALERFLITQKKIFSFDWILCACHSSIQLWSRDVVLSFVRSSNKITFVIFEG